MLKGRPTLREMFDFVLGRIESGERHLHHSACAHNLSLRQQRELGIETPYRITPEEWQIEVPWET